MGTRSLTHFKDEQGTTLTTIYRQFDGYPSGIGADIKTALYGKIVNGLGGDKEPVFNGMGCAAASLVKALKDGPGNVYIYPPNACECGEEYVYTVSQKNGAFHLVVHAGPITMFGGGGDKIENLTPIYDGSLADFDPDKEFEDD